MKRNASLSRSVRAASTIGTFTRPPVLPEYPRPRAYLPRRHGVELWTLAPAGKATVHSEGCICQVDEEEETIAFTVYRAEDHPCPGKGDSFVAALPPSTDFHVLAGMELLQRRGGKTWLTLLTWVALSHPRKPLNLSYQDAELAVLHQRIHRAARFPPPTSSQCYRLEEGASTHAERPGRYPLPSASFSSSHSPLPDLPDICPHDYGPASARGTKSAGYLCGCTRVRSMRRDVGADDHNPKHRGLRIPHSSTIAQVGFAYRGGHKTGWVRESAPRIAALPTRLLHDDEPLATVALIDARDTGGGSIPLRRDRHDASLHRMRERSTAKNESCATMRRAGCALRTLGYSRYPADSEQLDTPRCLAPMIREGRGADGVSHIEYDCKLRTLLSKSQDLGTHLPIPFLHNSLSPMSPKTLASPVSRYSTWGKPNSFEFVRGARTGTGVSWSSSAVFLFRMETIEASAGISNPVSHLPRRGIDGLTNTWQLRSSVVTVSPFPEFGFRCPQVDATLRRRNVVVTFRSPFAADHIDCSIENPSITISPVVLAFFSVFTVLTLYHAIVTLHFSAAPPK
ncbi:hypothetical protein B0H13DRAFT_2383127 [Mycena leptocephala]|nr:hypothetical protein B0H13DRAFT_2383127 [Mycena leptocephala]